MLSIDDYNALAQVVDTTWGKASTDATPTISVKMSLVSDDTAVVKYITVVTYAGYFTQQMQQAEFEVAQRAIDAYLKAVKKEFKAATGRTLKLKLRDVDPFVEHIDVNTFSPLRAVRTVYYRCVGDVALG